MVFWLFLKFIQLPLETIFNFYLFLYFYHGLIISREGISWVYPTFWTLSWFDCFLYFFLLFCIPFFRLRLFIKFNQLVREQNGFEPYVNTFFSLHLTVFSFLHGLDLFGCIGLNPFNAKVSLCRVVNNNLILGKKWSWRVKVGLVGRFIEIAQVDSHFYVM